MAAQCACNECSTLAVDQMLKKVLIVLGAVVFGMLGVALYQLQGPVEEPFMNCWGIISFTFLGASFGCFALEPPESFSGFFDRWL